LENSLVPGEGTFVGAVGRGLFGLKSCAGSAGKSTPEFVTVSRWGREGLEAGDWVMKGDVNYWNYIRSFKWERTPWNQAAPYSTGASYLVPDNSLINPTGWEAFKIIFGQRIYMP